MKACCCAGMAESSGLQDLLFYGRKVVPKLELPDRGSGKPTSVTVAEGYPACLDEAIQCKLLPASVKETTHCAGCRERVIRGQLPLKDCEGCTRKCGQCKIVQPVAQYHYVSSKEDHKKTCKGCLKRSTKRAAVRLAEPPNVREYALALASHVCPGCDAASRLCLRRRPRPTSSSACRS